MFDSSHTLKPFFESPPSDGGRRLLLVSYHFAPDWNVGALRWEMMLRHAAKRGWTADVLMMYFADDSAVDRTRLDMLPPGTRLFGVKLPSEPLIAFLQWRQRFVPQRRRNAGFVTELSREQPVETHRWPPVLVNHFRRVKRNILARSYYRRWRRWAAAATDCGVAMARDTKYECVVSSGPPHMAHEAARQIALATAIPLVTDFRDPWASEDAAPPSLDGKVWKLLSHKYEKLALEASALILANTDSAGRLTASKYPHLARKIRTVMNGADGEVSRSGSPSPRFTIAYAGSLYGGRNPQPLFRAVRRAVEIRGLSRDDLLVLFMGVEESQRKPLVEMAAREGIGSFFTCETWRPRSEATLLLDRASLVVLLAQVHIHSTPAKLFEYVQRNVWILALSEPGTAVAELLQDTAADIVSPNDVDAVAGVIVRRYDESRQGKRPAPLNANGRFSRERQTEYFLAELERVLQRSALDAAVGSGSV